MRSTRSRRRECVRDAGPSPGARTMSRMGGILRDGNAADRTVGVPNGTVVGMTRRPGRRVPGHRAGRSSQIWRRVPVRCCPACAPVRPGMSYESGSGAWPGLPRPGDVPRRPRCDAAGSGHDAAPGAVVGSCGSRCGALAARWRPGRQADPEAVGGMMAACVPVGRRPGCPQPVVLATLRWRGGGRSMNSARRRPDRNPRPLRVRTMPRGRAPGPCGIDVGYGACRGGSAVPAAGSRCLRYQSTSAPDGKSATRPTSS